VWDGVSEPAKHLIKLMLTYDPEGRISAADAYQHEWLHSGVYAPLDPSRAQELMQSMSKFCVGPFTILA
jgi:calcium-dependent protein kinase